MKLFLKTLKTGAMKVKILFLLAFAALVIASCSTYDEEPAPQHTRAKLLNKKWYPIGTNSQNWVLYMEDGSWESGSGDNGKWSLENGKVLKISASQDLLQNWEEEILELTDSYLKTKIKGVSMAKEYQTAP